MHDNMEMPSTSGCSMTACGVSDREKLSKCKWEKNANYSDSVENTRYRSRPQTPSSASKHRTQFHLVRSKQSLPHETENCQVTSVDYAGQTPKMHKFRGNFRGGVCDDVPTFRTPLSNIHTSCSGVLRLSCETPPTTFWDYSGATPRKQSNTYADLVSAETTECCSYMNIDTPKQILGEETSNLIVGVRVRPFNNKEINDPSITNAVEVDKNEITVTCATGTHRFSYDHCFCSCDDISSEFADQDTVFTVMAQPLLDKVLKGYNACLFAYGQTGSGKSYSMMGLETDGGSQNGKEAGIIPRFCRALFDAINGSGENKDGEDSISKQMTVEISYLEIYNEKIHDLLSSSADREKRTPLKVREHPELGPYVVDLSQHGVTSYEDLKEWLTVANSQRATAATVMNEKSSRSHSVFTIILTQIQTDILEGKVYENKCRSRINLVDLAGSERLSQTCATGDRLREGVSINRSLLTLGKVIASLAENSSNRKRQFIPYRESVLTWLLKESLGGNARTAMLATISPTSIHVEETIATLRYACQARTIVNRVRINEDPRDRVIRYLREEVERLRTSRGEYGHQIPVATPLSSSSKQNQFEDYQCDLNEVKLELESYQEQPDFNKEEFAEDQRLKEELEEAKRRAIIQLEEAEKNFGFQRNEYEKQIKELSQSLDRHVKALAEAQKERDKLSIRICALEEKVKSGEDCLKNNVMNCSIDVPLAPYQSNFLEEVMKALNESTHDPEFLMPNDTMTLHDIKMMILEGKERCRQAEIKFDFYLQHNVKNKKLTPVIKVHNLDSDLVAVWEPQFFAEWLNQLRVHETGEDTEELKRGNGMWEENEEILPQDESSHLLSLSMSEIKQQLDDTINGSDYSDSPSNILNEISHSINSTIQDCNDSATDILHQEEHGINSSTLEDEGGERSNYSIIVGVESSIQQIENSVHRLKDLLKDLVNTDIEDSLNMLNDTTVRLKSLLNLSSAEYSWQETSNSHINCDSHIAEEDEAFELNVPVDYSETSASNKNCSSPQQSRKQKTVRFTFTNSQQQIDDC